MTKGFACIFSILFLASSFMPGEGLRELNKLPTLIGHYHQHQQEENESLSFIDFLVMHYGEDSGHKTEENHEDLPLFHQCCSCLFFISETTPTLTSGGEPLVVSYITAYRNTYEHDMHHSIFQPPRFS